MSQDSSHDDTAEIHRHHTPFNFTILPNSTIRDSRLSWAAKGLLVHLLSLPHDWKIHVAQLATFYTGEKRGNGITAVYNILDELKKYRYFFHTLTKNPDGTWKHRYDVHDQPQPDTVKREAVKGDALQRPIPKSTDKKKIVIAQETQPQPEEKTPAVGNNNFSAKKQEEKKIFPCLKDLDLPENTKKSITAKHTEPEVEHAAKLLTHKDSPYHGKPKQEAAKIIQSALNAPESFKQTIDNLGQPKLTKQQRWAKEEEIKRSDNEERKSLNREWIKKKSFLKHGKIYNGWKCSICEDYISFTSKKGGACIYYLEKDFIGMLNAHLKHYGIDIPIV